jgi:hypothetical protein
MYRLPFEDSPRAVQSEERGSKSLAGHLGSQRNARSWFGEKSGQPGSAPAPITTRTAPAAYLNRRLAKFVAVIPKHKMQRVAELPVRSKKALERFGPQVHQRKLRRRLRNLRIRRQHNFLQ